MLASGLIIDWWDIYRHALRIQHRLDCFRNIEYAFAVRHLKMSSDKVHVEVGAADSPIPSLLAFRYRPHVICSDLFPETMEPQKRYLRMLDLPEDRIELQRQDMTQMTFADNSIDSVGAVSCVEHIPGEGDRAAMKEIHRVLKPGGTCVVTVPALWVMSESESTYYYDAYERRYDPFSLYDRLVPEGMGVQEILYMTCPKYQFFSELCGQVGNPLDLWMQSGWHDRYPDLSIVPSMFFIHMQPKPDEGIFGACMMMKKI